MRPERQETIAVLRAEGSRRGIAGTPLGEKMLEFADRLETRPNAAPKHAPVHHAPLSIPSGASSGLDLSLPRGDREDLSDQAVLSLFDREPGSDG